MRGGKVPKTVDEYLAKNPTRSQHPRAYSQGDPFGRPQEATEVISYRIPIFKYNGMLIGYAAFAKHCSLFPTGSGLIERFKKELAGYHTSRGTIQFPSDKGFPDALLKKIVKARVKQNQEWD